MSGGVINLGKDSKGEPVLTYDYRLTDFKEILVDWHSEASGYARDPRSLPFVRGTVHETFMKLKEFFDDERARGAAQHLADSHSLEP